MKLLKGLLLCIWLGLIITAIYFFNKWEIPLSDYPAQITSWLDMMGGWAPVVYILIYLARPLILMPATLITVVSGLVFGPVWGLLYTIIASNLSASLMFFVGRFFGHESVSKADNKFMKKLNQRVEKNGFMTVLVMRLLYFPFDLVNIGCGVSTIRYIDFAISTFLGMLSGTATFVLLGGAAGSAVGLDGSEGIDPVTKTWITLGVSALFFVGGLLISRYLEKKHQDLAALKETT